MSHQIDETNFKVQYALYGITGSLYKKGFSKNYESVYKLQKRHSKIYGGYLSMRTVVVPKKQYWHSQINEVPSQYCFCSETPLFVNKCSICGKSPYTD